MGITSTVSMVNPTPDIESLKNRLGLKTAVLLPEHIEVLETLARDIGVSNLARPRVAEKVSRLLEKLPKTDSVRGYLKR